jgi:hypothetical protein
MSELTTEDLHRIVEFWQADGHPANWILFEQKWPALQQAYPKLANGIAKFLAGKQEMEAGMEQLADELGIDLTDGGGLT